MKKLSVIVLMTSLAGCGNNGSDTASSVSSGSSVLLAETAVNGAAASPATADSNQFLATAYQDGQGKIQLSQLALQKSTNGKIKTFAQRMIDQHGAMNNQILQLAQGKNIALPNDLTPDQKTEADRLSALPVDQFDRAFMQSLVTSHEVDVAAFRQQAAQGTDADVQMLADLTLPILKIHLAAAKDIHSAIDPAAFLIHVYQAGLAEIDLSQLALQKASGSDVRDFAQRMIDDHTRANNQIAGLAQQKSVALPATVSPDHQAAAAELSRFSGVDFDKAYMDINTIDHAKTTRLLRKQARDGQDPDVRSLARSNLAVVEGHLVMAVEIGRPIEAGFLYNAYQDGKAEVRLSQLALLKTTNDTVRTFAQKMIDDHKPANTSITQLAQQKNVPLPDDMSPEQTLALVVLLRLSGQDFDQAFMQYSERLHRHAVSDFTTQSQQGTDADLRSFAQNTLPVLTTHLVLAQETLQLLSIEGQ